MKTIKIKFVGYWKGFDYERTVLYKILSKHYQVEVSESPDYVICSCFGEPYAYCKYPQVRIMYVGENYLPDFNLVDYGICNYPVTFLDRAFYFPFCIDEFGHCESLVKKNRFYAETILEEKDLFCNFIAGHESEFNIRGDFFKELNRYRRVESAGTYLNNMSNCQTVRWDDDSKNNLQKRCKFTLCFESTKHEGFITEKIVDAFMADTIPIYYGSDSIKEIFNPKAFINVADFTSFKEAIDRIIEIDKNDEAYLAMLREPIFINRDFVTDMLSAFEKYLCYIFDQPLERAYRRSRVYTPEYINRYLANAVCPTGIGPVKGFRVFLSSFFYSIKRNFVLFKRAFFRMFWYRK